jgi:hypothetical protein
MQWIEAIINISALAGFVGVANLGRKKPDQEIVRPFDRHPYQKHLCNR